MQRRKLNRREVGRRSTEGVLAQREGQLVCRSCGQPCPRKDALGSPKQGFRCPRCGGRLDREAGPVNGQPKA